MKRNSNAFLSDNSRKASDCAHHIQYAGLCVDCGCIIECKASGNLDSSGIASVPILHNTRDILVTEDMARQLVAKTECELQAQRKLALIIDLDQTVLHASVSPDIADWLEDPTHPNYHRAHGHIHAVRLNDPYQPIHYIKLRPYLHAFLEAMHGMYQMHIYTMGSRDYANQVVRGLIDPSGKYFADRILSRDENEIVALNRSSSSSSAGTDQDILNGDDYVKSFKLSSIGSMTGHKAKILGRKPGSPDRPSYAHVKSLNRIFPLNEHMAVIIDDRFDVWQDCPNLIRVTPYRFFLKTDDINAGHLNNSFQGPLQQQQRSPKIPGIESCVTEDKDEELLLIGKILRDLYRAYYRSDKHLCCSGSSSSTTSSHSSTSSCSSDSSSSSSSLASSSVDVPSKQDSSDGQRSTIDLLRDLKQQVLSGCRIVFSGINPISSGDIPLDQSQTFIWRYALEFGALVAQDLHSGITHLVAANAQTDKAETAKRMPGVAIVRQEWLYDSIARWQRQDERRYLLHPVCPVDAKPEDLMFEDSDNEQDDEKDNEQDNGIDESSDFEEYTFLQ